MDGVPQANVLESRLTSTLAFAQVELFELRLRHSQLHEPSNRICKITMHNVT